MLIKTVLKLVVSKLSGLLYKYDIYSYNYVLPNAKFGFVYNKIKFSVFCRKLIEKKCDMKLSLISSQYFKPDNFKIKFMFCCLFFTGVTVKAQSELLYSQYMYNMININPAYAGNRVGDNITSVYRKQWVNIQGAPTTYSLSWDRGNEDVGDGLHVNRTPMGIGIQIYYDKVGIEGNLGVQAFYSYRIKFYNSYLSLGASAGVYNYTAKYSQVNTEHGGDPLFQEDISAYLPTAGIGALFASDTWYIGLSVPALLQTKIHYNEYQVTTGANCHYFLTGGYVFTASQALKVKPSILVKVVKGQDVQFDFNVNGWINNTVGLGVSYRMGDALVGMFDLRVTPKVTLGYAYDYMISNLKSFSSGSHELMIKLELNGPRNQNVISPRYY